MFDGKDFIADAESREKDQETITITIDDSEKVLVSNEH